MKNIFKIKKKKNLMQGFTLVEVLVACVIITTTILALMSATSKGIELSNMSLRQVQANMIIEEGVEAVKSIRDTDWMIISNLNTNTNYYLTFNTNAWSLGTTKVSGIDQIFERSIIFSPVYRDNNDDIASSGTLDIGIKKVQVVVTWPSHSRVISKNITFYLANIFN